MKFSHDKNEWNKVDLSAQMFQEKLSHTNGISNGLYQDTLANLSEVRDRSDPTMMSRAINNSKHTIVDFPFLEEKIKDYRERVEFLQQIVKSYQTSGNISQIQLPPQEIGILANEGDKLRRALYFQQKDSSAIECLVLWVEKLSHEIQIRVEEISSALTIEILDRIPKMILGFVDMSEEIAKRKKFLIMKFQHLQNNIIGPCYSEGRSKRGSPRLLFEEHTNEQQKYPKKQHLQEFSQCLSPSNERKMQTDEFERKINKSYNERSKISWSQENNQRVNASETFMNYEIPREYESYMKKRTAEKTQYGSKANQTNSENLEVIVTLQEILENYGHPPFDRRKSLEVARQIVTYLPGLMHSKEFLSHFTAIFIMALKNPKIYQILIDNAFSVDTLTNLIEEHSLGSPSTHRKFDHSNNNFVEQDHADESIYDSSFENVKKKVKKDVDSKSINAYATPVAHRTNKYQDLMQSTEMVKSDVKTNCSTEESQRISIADCFDKKFAIEREESGDPQKFNLDPRNREPLFDPRRFPDERVQQHKNIFERNLCPGKENLINQKNLIMKITPILQTEKQPGCSKASLCGPVLEPAEHVYKLFYGALKGIERQPIRCIGFYSCDSLEKLSTIPKFQAAEESMINIDHNIDYLKFQSRILKLLSTFDPLNKCVISGWIEGADDNSQAECDLFAISLLETNKVGVLKYSGCVKVYFIHRNQIMPEWIHWLKFTRIKLRKNSCSRLCYLLVFRKLSTLDSYGRLQSKLFEPEKIIPYTEDRLSSTSDNRNIDKFSYSQSFTERKSPGHNKNTPLRSMDQLRTPLSSNKHQERGCRQEFFNTNPSIKNIQEQKIQINVEKTNGASNFKNTSDLNPTLELHNRCFQTKNFEEKNRNTFQPGTGRISLLKFLDSQDPSDNSKDRKIDAEPRKNYPPSFSTNAMRPWKREDVQKESTMFTPLKSSEEKKVLYGSNAKKMFLNSESDITSDRKSSPRTGTQITYPVNDRDRERFSYSKPPIQFKTKKICSDKDSAPILPMWERMIPTPKKEAEPTLLQVDPYNIDFTEDQL